MSKGTKDDPKRKVILSQEIVSIKETSPISIHFGSIDISPKQKTPGSPSSSSSSSEENSQSFHSKNQEGQSSGQVSEIHELAGSRRSEMGSPTSEILVPRFEFSAMYKKRRTKTFGEEIRD